MPKAVGCQSGEVCRRRHTLNLELNSTGNQGKSEPGEFKGWEPLGVGALQPQ
jgi:hypothetical protein